MNSEQMIDQGQNDYLLEVQKLMSSDVIATYWSHNMDLLVVVTLDNLLELYRINFKAQKVFQIEQDKPITAVSFSPDSQHIAYGTNDGETKVLKTQNGQLLLTVNDPINQQIKTFNFVQYGKYPIAKIFPFKQNQIIQKLILQISPHKNCNKTSIVKINYYNELCDNDQDLFTLLLSSSDKHTSINLNGFITIAQINYEMIAAKYFAKNDYWVQYSHFNQKNKNVQSVVVENFGDKYAIHHIQFENRILSEMQPDIIKFNCLLSYVSEIISFVELSYPAAEVFLRDILRQYNQKINLIDDPDQQNINPCQELFKYLNCGITGTPLLNFLTKQVYDSKVLQKLDQTLNAIFNSLHDLLLQSIQNSLQRAYLLTTQIKNLCQLQKYKIFGIKQKDLIKIQQQILKLYTMGQILLIESTQAKFDIRNLLVWLNKSSIKTSSDPNAEIENTKSYLNRYTVDFTRLHSFLQTEDSFKLQNLTAFFTKGNQSHSMKIPSCQFRLLNRQNNPNFLKKQQYQNKTKQIQKLLELQDIIIDNPQQNKMDVQLNYKSFKLELKQLKDEWKFMKVKPIIQISKNIEQKYKITKIAEVEANEMFVFDIKTLLKKNESNEQNTQNYSQLLLYFIERSGSMTKSHDKIVEYNTSTKQRRHIILPHNCQPISLAVGVDIILLIQNPQKMQQQKSVIQVLNSEWNGQELQIGKRIDKLNGEIMLNAGLRGLNSIIINKNKLVVFD